MIEQGLYMHSFHFQHANPPSPQGKEAAISILWNFLIASIQLA